MIRWREDLTGYPMLYIPALQAWVHALPITKAQFAGFLAQFNDPAMVSFWEILKCGPDVSSLSFDHSNYEGVFLSGVPIEAVKKYISWCGPQYRLMNNRQWQLVYSWMLTQPVHARPSNWYAFSQSALNIWDGLERALHPKNLAEQLLMVDGLLEWVIDHEKIPTSFAGMGRPRSSFWNVLRHPADPPVYPIEDITPFGFRLIWSEQ